MSFVTKRERVFNEYKLYDLPARNEGKLKAYASCTDARAWSHFIADKSEHLFEIIKRNNEKCRPKYIPTEVIVDTLMMAKNAQISRLKKKIKQLQRLIAVYDHLDLNEEQKYEIAKAHATIKAANKELNDLYMHLDLSGDVEGIDSEVFGTGKSRGDEISRSTDVETAKSSISEWSYIKEPTPQKSLEQTHYEQNQHDGNIDQIDETNQIGYTRKMGDADNFSSIQSNFSDAGTNAEEDPRIEELQHTIVTKDAKLNAMQNTIAVLENDVCEPYCIYAHIYTALEKIFGILRQNLKYKQYLDLLTLGKDTRHIHIKGKILYKIRILEKFSTALIAPCSSDKPQRCNCYRAEVLTGYETTYAVSATESSQAIIDKKRAHLIADIIDVDEIKQALNDQNLLRSESDSATEFFYIDECNTQNKCCLLIKSLQLSYGDLLSCYDNLKNEKDMLYVRCQELLKVEDEIESLRNNMRDYNSLRKEMEYFRRRSDSLDKLKAKYYLLLNETTNFESKFVAECEKNKMYLDTVNELRNENLSLDKKLKETLLAHEKEISSLIFKMKEIECDNMCKEQQIENLSCDIQKYLSHRKVRKHNLQIDLLDQIAKGEDQIKETCICKNVAIEHLQQEINNNLEYINELKSQAELWERKYDDAVNIIDTLNNEIRINNIRNHELSELIDEKNNAVDNLHSIIKDKLEQIESLNEKLAQQERENFILPTEINKTQYDLEKKLPAMKYNDVKNTNNYEEISKAKTNIFELKENEKNPETKTHNTLSHIEKPTSGNSTSVYTDNYAEQQKTLLSIPEREGTILNKHPHDLTEYRNDNILLYENIEKRSSKTDTNNIIPSMHSYAEDVNTEISKIQNDLKGKLSLLETEQLFVTKQNSADSLSLNSYDCGNNQNSSGRKLPSQQSTTSTQNDDIKSHQRKSLKSVKKRFTELNTEIVKYKDKNSVNDSIHKEILDKCEQNENLKQELKRKECEIKKLLTEINKIRNSFQEKILSLEVEKQNLLNNSNKDPNYVNIVSRSSKDDGLLLDEPLSTNNDQKDITSQFKLLSEDSSTIIDKYDDVKEIYRISLETANNETEYLKSQVTEINEISKSLQELMIKYNELMYEKNVLQNEVYVKTKELNNYKNNYQQLQYYVQELEPFKLKYEILHTETKNKISNNELEINELIMTVESLQQNIRDLEQLCNTLNLDKEKIKISLEDKISELKTNEEQFELNKIENKDLVSKINTLEMDNDSKKNRIYLLENDILSMRSQIDFLNEEVIGKNNELLDLKKLNEKFTNITTYNEEMKKENDKLQQGFETYKKALQNLKDENKVFKELNKNISSEMETIKTTLKIKEEEIIRTNSAFEDIREEIETIKAEKSSDNVKIFDLLNKLQLCEQIINKLKEDLTEKNNTISELQNHINNLQEEIKKLHESLEFAIENSEKINQEGIDEINQSAKKVKAHYSKATHNIKPEIAKLQDMNERLSLLKLCSKKTDIEKEKCITKINSLENERETVTHNLNQLEIAVLGNSKLSNKSCTKDIIDVLHNIQKAYEDENKYYEQKIQNAQSSYELLKDKAKEAQEIARIERQKMINEKEINEQNHLSMERKFQELHEQVHNNDTKHENVIKDLEMKLLGQQNLFEQINKSKEIRIANLITEVSNLTEIYQKSLADIEELRQKLKVSEDNNNLQSSQMKTLYDDYQKSCNETKVLQEMLQNIKSNENDTNTDNSLSINYPKEDNSNVPKIIESSSDIRKSKLEKLQTETLKQYSICALCDIGLNNFNLQISNTDVPSKIYDTVEIIPNRRNSFKSDDVTKTEFIMNKNCNDKEIQTVDDHFNLIVRNNNSVQLNMNPKPQNQLSDKNSISPYIMNKSENLPERPKSQNDYNIISNDSVPEEKYLRYQYAPYNVKYGDIAVKDITMKESQNAPSISHTHSQENLNSFSKAITLNNNMLNEEELKNNDFKKHQDIIIPRKEKEYQSKYSIKNDNAVANNSTNQLKNNLQPESKSTVNLQDQTYNESNNINHLLKMRRSRSYETISELYRDINFDKIKSNLVQSTNLSTPVKSSYKVTLQNFNTLETYEKKIEKLFETLAELENDHHKKIEAIKQQYGNHIKNIINEHNKGVVGIQTLHEETLGDVIKIHDIEIENLRALSVEAMTKTEKLEKENEKLRLKLELKEFNQRSVETEPKVLKRKSKFRATSSYLTKTDVEAFNVKPKRKTTISCACAVNINVSDVVRNIFEQVDTKNNRMAEEIYLKYIADKLMDGIETLKPRELSFLHFKVCRIWKTLRNKDKALKDETVLIDQNPLSIEIHPTYFRHERESEKVIKARRRCQDKKKVTFKVVPVKTGGAKVQDPGLLDSKKNKKDCGCVYKVKHKEG